MNLPAKGSSFNGGFEALRRAVAMFGTADFGTVPTTSGIDPRVAPVPPTYRHTFRRSINLPSCTDSNPSTLHWTMIAGAGQPAPKGFGSLLA